MLNGLDVAKGTASNLPPSLFAPSPQLAGFAVTSGTGPRLTEAELAPLVAEAKQRWAAAGADGFLYGLRAVAPFDAPRIFSRALPFYADGN